MMGPFILVWFIAQHDLRIIILRLIHCDCKSFTASLRLYKHYLVHDICPDSIRAIYEKDTFTHSLCHFFSHIPSPFSAMMCKEMLA